MNQEETNKETELKNADYSTDSKLRFERLVVLLLHKTLKDIKIDQEQTNRELIDNLQCVIKDIGSNQIKQQKEINSLIRRLNTAEQMIEVLKRKICLIKCVNKNDEDIKKEKN